MKGFSLIELLVVVAILGILSAIALPSYLNQRNKAIYADALIQMGGISPLLQEYAAENGRYPADELPNVAPEGVRWLPIDRASIPFESFYDYDHWSLGGGHWSLGRGTCIVQITFFGANQERDSERYTDEEDGDDRIVRIAAYECDRAAGAVGE